MPYKEITDYVAHIRGCKDRILYEQHIRNNLEKKTATFILRDQQYAVRPTRAFTIKNYRPVRWKFALRDYFGRKRVALLLYEEYCDHQCKHCPEKKDCQCPEVIEPYSPGITHQPSGRLVTEEPEIVEFDGVKELSLLETTTPAMLKTSLENRFYEQSYGTFPFGKVTQLARRYVILIVAGFAILVVMMLYLTGNLPVR